MIDEELDIKTDYPRNIMEDIKYWRHQHFGPESGINKCGVIVDGDLHVGQKSWGRVFGHSDFEDGTFIYFYCSKITKDIKGYFVRTVDGKYYALVNVQRIWGENIPKHL